MISSNAESCSADEAELVPLEYIERTITILDARQYITGQMVGLPDQGDVATALKA